ncbi:hypothetical protein GALMADRAFT_270592 [Galerina marginata CBS 339.88]|uniref:Dipeptidyl-peptidase V n=1 Tax=Galerina marginata (strain CBS 339.88) TaxID=685588 RepID=A0A067SY55_GALM3|nr:hypothetical protein GALMADRAFT_270592 [Galerina marginata CBS 339.88]
MSSNPPPNPGDGSATAITPQDIASAESVQELKLSKDGSRVIYTVGPIYKSGDHNTSALWVAETFVEGSARQITSGTNCDFSPSFHPTSSNQIFFLSDRDEGGGSAHLFTMFLSGADSYAETSVKAVLELEDLQGLASYSVSPNGNFIAFTVETKSSKKGEKEAISFWRENKHYNTLNLLDLRQSSKTMRTLVSVNNHVGSFSWSPDSTSIVYRLVSHLDAEARSSPMEEKIVSISSGATRDAFQHTRQPNGDTIWREHGDLIFLQAVNPSELCSVTALWSRESTGNSPAKRLAYGERNDVNDLVDIGSKSQYAVEVAENLITKFDVYGEDNKYFTAFQTTVDYAMGYEWDMVLTEDGKYIFATTKSSAVSSELGNIWSGVTEFGKEGVLSKKLSAHHAWFNSKVAPDTKPFYWTGSDDMKLEGVISFPRGVELKNLPTVVVAHGGPSSRDTLGLAFSFASWRLFLATHGYLALSPNYRGSTGRGDSFAMAASGGVGGIEWSDIETMIEEGISRGIVDPERIGIAGYSQGGFLAALGCTRPNNKFKVGVVGAGVSDWGILAATSDLPDVEADLGGGAPWKHGEPRYLRGSPLKDVKNVTAPILILHGKDDARVPLTQGVALLRGIEREAKPTAPPKLVVYPREGHIFEERDNAEDILRRLLEHIDKYLK